MLFSAPKEEDPEEGSPGRETEALQQGHSPGEETSSLDTPPWEGGLGFGQGI